MTTRKADLIDEIIELLSLFFYSVDFNTKLNRLQQNIDAEDLVCDLLNLINNWALVNLNNKKQNYEGVDLGDFSERVCVQVTSDIRRNKVESTLQIFEENGYEKDFDRLIFVYLKLKKTSFSKTFNTNKISFNAKEDTIDLEDIVRLIKNLDVEKIEKIHDYLNKEIVFSIKTTKEEVACNSKLQLAKIKTKCIAKLKSLGLDTLIAWRIFANSLENLSLTVADDSAGLRFLVGGFGSGKSHQLYCLYIKLAKLYETDSSNYFPAFFEAKNFQSRNELMNAIKNLELELRNRVCIIIDGLDEMPMDMAQFTVEELELLSQSNDFVKILVSSRPLTIISDKIQIKASQLSLVDINTLFCLINDAPIGHRLEKKEVLLQTISKPFCAVLYCLYWKNHYFFNEMDFVRTFISKSVNQIVVKYPECEKNIKKLAVKAIDFNYGNIDKSEVRSIAELNKILLTGLFLEEERGISFALPITAQWLAAKALRDELVHIEEIANNENRLIKWIYPLAILFNQVTFDESKRFFEKILEKAPGIASVICKIGVDLNVGTANENKYFNGENLYYALSSWLKVFQFKNLPYYNNNRLNTLFFNQEGNIITYAISNAYLGKNVEIKKLDFESYSSEIYYLKECRIASQPTWPWIEALTFIRKAILGKALKERRFMIEGSILEHEYIWSTSLNFIHSNGRVTDAIDIVKIDEMLKKWQKSEALTIIGKGIIDFNLLSFEVNKMRCRGVARIECPYIRGSLPSGSFVWSQYKTDEMKTLIEKVYTEALNAYKTLVEYFFPVLKEQMGIYKLLPAKMEGYFEFKGHPINCPFIMWGLVPTGKQESYAELKDGNTSNLLEFARDMENRVKNIDFEKPYMSHFVSAGGFEMSSETPVTDIIYDWLKKDLSRLEII